MYERQLKSGKGVEAAIKSIRGVVPPLTQDRVLTGDIEAVVALLRGGLLG